MIILKKAFNLESASCMEEKAIKSVGKFTYKRAATMSVRKKNIICED